MAGEGEEAGRCEGREAGVDGSGEPNPRWWRSLLIDAYAAARVLHVDRRRYMFAFDSSPQSSRHVTIITPPRRPARCRHATRECAAARRRGRASRRGAAPSARCRKRRARAESTSHRPTHAQGGAVGGGPSDAVFKCLLSSVCSGRCMRKSGGMCGSVVNSAGMCVCV